MKLHDYPELQEALEKTTLDSIEREKQRIKEERAFLAKLRRNHKAPLVVFILNRWTDEGGKHALVRDDEAGLEELLQRAVNLHHELNPVGGKVNICNISVYLAGVGRGFIDVPQKYWSGYFEAIKQ